MSRLMLIAAGLLVVVACNDAVTNPDASLVRGPQFAKWTTSPSDGCTATAGVKFQQQGGGLKVTGTSGIDVVDCSASDRDIKFSGGDGDDEFTGGTGDDHMAGGNGDDTLIGGGGTNVAIGGEHNSGDTCSAETVIGCETII